jgi:hypothetical protein
LPKTNLQLTSNLLLTSPTYRYLLVPMLWRILQPATYRMLKKEIEYERKNRVFAEKELAEANLLLDKMKCEAKLLLGKMKGEKLTLSDLIKSQKAVAKKELDAKAAIIEAQVQLKKDAHTSKAAFKKYLKVLKTR